LTAPSPPIRSDRENRPGPCSSLPQYSNSPRPEKLQKVPHQLRVLQKGLIGARLLFLFYKLIEPLRDGENSQDFAARALHATKLTSKSKALAIAGSLRM
jgi:hypothetical protein